MGLSLWALGRGCTEGCAELCAAEGEILASVAASTLKVVELRPRMGTDLSRGEAQTLPSALRSPVLQDSQP